MERFLGQTLKGRYRLNEIIGIGGMAVVYKAYDQVLAQDVAVKILKDEYIRNDEFRRRFSNESKAITLLADKNIVDIFDVSLDGEVMFIAMEYLDGVTLKEYIDKVGALEWREATHYIKQILSAVQHAHARGVVHRDLKPQNIMLLRDGTIKVMDFGIARVADFETQSMSKEAIGSVHYISPEQASGDALDERTDIYSIGIMLYQLCTGALPFDDENAVSVALMQIQEQPALPRDLKDDLPIGLEQIILRAMMKNPFDRYMEASDMLADIERIEENPAYMFRADEYGQNEAAHETEKPKKKSSILVPFDDEELSAEEKKKLSTKLPIFSGIASAFALFLCILIGMFIVPDAVAEKKYEVPNLINKMFDEVVADAEYEKFKIVKKGEKPSEKKKGTILSQSVPEFSMVKEGTVIEVYVSSGSQIVCLPDITGMPISKAKEILEDNQIPFKTIELYSDNVAKGHVISTSIKPGDEVDLSQDVVIVYVSKGPENDHVKVPDLSGMTVDEARKAVADVGLDFNSTVEEVFDDMIEKGLVVRQTPAAGSSVDKGKTVSIIISKGPDPAAKPKTGSISVTVSFDTSFAGQMLNISIKQGATILGAQEISYEMLRDGVFLWDGTADVGENVTVLVNGVEQKSITIAEGLNTVSIAMVGETTQIPDDPDDPPIDNPDPEGGTNPPVDDGNTNPDDGTTPPDDGGSTTNPDDGTTPPDEGGSTTPGDGTNPSDQGNTPGGNNGNSGSGGNNNSGSGNTNAGGN